MLKFSMADKTVVDYIQVQKRKGVVKEAIVTELKKAGWSDVQIDEGFASTQSGATQTSSSILLGPVELIKQTYSMFKLRWKVYVLISFIVGAINLSLSGLFSGLIVVNIPALSNVPTIMVLLPLVFILMWFIGMYGSMVIYSSVSLHKEGIGIGESLSRPWHKIGPLTLTFALYGLIVLAGYVFLIIPGIIFVMWFIFGMYLTFERNVSGIDALLLSREYVRGLEVEVFWRLLAFGLLMAGIFIGVMIPFGILYGLATFSLGNEASAVLSIFQFILNASAQAITVPATTIYTYLIFDNVKSLKGDVSVPKSTDLRTGFYFIAGLGLVLLIGIPIVVVSFINALPMFDRQSDYYDTYDSSSNNIQDRENIDISYVQFLIGRYKTDTGKFPVSLEDLAPKYTSSSKLDRFLKSENIIEYYQLDSGERHQLCITFKGKQDERHCVTNDLITTHYLPEAPPEEHPYLRDKDKYDVLLALQSVLDQYYRDNNSYPVKLGELSTYIDEQYSGSGMAFDLTSKSDYPYAPYPYTRGDDGKSYQICIEYEVSTPRNQCVSESTKPLLEQGSYSQ